MANKLLKIIVIIVLSMIGVCIILAGGMAAYLYQYGGLSGFSSAMLARNIDGLEAEFKTVKWRFDTANTALVITGEETIFAYHGQAVDIPRLDLVFTPASVVTGIPSEIAIDADQIKLVRSEAGWAFIDRFSWLNERLLAASSGTEARSQLAIGWQFWPEGLARLKIRADKIDIYTHGPEMKLEAQLQEVTFVAAPEGSDLRLGDVNFSLQLSQPFNSSHQVPMLNLNATSNLFSGLTEFSLEASDLNITPLRQLLLADDRYKSYEFSTFTGSLQGTFDGLSAQLLSGNISAKSGRMDLADFFDMQTDFESFEIKFDYSQADDLLIIHNSDLVLADGQILSVMIQVTDLYKPLGLVSGTVIGEDISFRKLLTKWPEEQAGDLRQFLTQQTDSGHFKTVAVQFEGGMRWAKKQFDITKMGISGEFSNLRLDYHDPQYESVIGTLSGQMELNIGAQGQINKASGSVSLIDGFARLTDYKPTVKIAKLTMDLRYQPDDAHLQKLSIDFAEKGELLITARRRKKSEYFETDMSIVAPFMEADLLKSIWPDKLAQPTIDWIDQHISKGDIKKAKMNFKLTEMPNNIQVSELNGNIPFSQATFQFFQDQTPFSNLYGNLIFADNQITADINAGNFKSLNLEQAQLIYGPFVNANGARNLSLNGTVAGDVLDILDMLERSKINENAGFTLRDMQISGDSRIRLDLRGNLPSGKPFEVTDIAVDGTLSDAVIASLPFDQTLSKGSLVISYSREAIRVSGSGLIAGIESDFSYQQTPDREANLQVRLKNSAALPALLSQYFDWPVAGTAGAKLSLSGQQDSDDYRLIVQADITDTALQSEDLGWAKLRGELGSLNLQMIFEEGVLTHIEAIDLKAGSLRAKGRVALGRDLLPSYGYLENVVFPGNDIKNILFERHDNSSLTVTAEGKLFNLISLRANDEIKKNMMISFDITADRIIIDPKVSFSGDLQGTIDKNGIGEASLQGNLFVNDQRFASEVSIKTFFGSGGEYLEGVGLIGGAEASLSFSPAENNQSILLITSKNAGRTLSGLQITDVIKEGNLRMATTYFDDSFSQYKTIIELEDFIVTEAPTAVRTFSVLSLAGLYGLVEGEGTQFTIGQAIIVSDGPEHRLEKVRAAGGALGIYMLGNYDRSTRNLDISGNLVPANQLSKILGAVPVLGELLTGVDKTGLFSTQFSMKGSLDDPNVTVNALALAPGILRDLFSPDWLGEERKRIFGLEAQTN